MPTCEICISVYLPRAAFPVGFSRFGLNDKFHAGRLFFPQESFGRSSRDLGNGYVIFINTNKCVCLFWTHKVAQLKVRKLHDHLGCPSKVRI